MNIQLKLIVAACENLGIAINNKIPWKLPKESAHFWRTITSIKNSGKSNVIIAGHKTWLEMLPRMRNKKTFINIVLSKQLQEPPEGAHHVANSFDAAIDILQQPDVYNVTESVWVVGGERVYKDAMESPYCFLIYFTRVKASFDCDVFFPAIPLDKFEVTSDPDVLTEEQEENAIRYQFEVYRRKAAI